MKDFDKDLNLSKIESEKEIESIFISENKNIEKFNNLNIPIKGVEFSSKEHSLEEMKQVFSKLDANKELLFKNELMDKLMKSRKTLSSSVKTFIMGLFSVFCGMFLSGVLGNLTADAGVMLILTLLLLVGLFLGLVSFVKYIRALMLHSSILKDLKKFSGVGLLNWGVPIFGLFFFFVFPPLAFIFSYAGNFQISQIIDKWLKEKNLGSLEDAIKEFELNNKK